MENKQITAKELARIYSLSESKIRKMTQREGLPCLRVGRSVRYNVDEVDRFLRARALKN